MNWRCKIGWHCNHTVGARSREKRVPLSPGCKQPRLERETYYVDKCCKCEKERRYTRTMWPEP